MKKFAFICLTCVWLNPDFSQNFNWAKSFGGNYEDDIMAITVDQLGNIYCVGYNLSVIDLDPGPGTFTLAPGPNNNGFVLKLDASGNFVWAKHTPSYTAGGYIKLDNNGNIFVMDIGSISKADPSGNFIWTKYINATATAFNSAWWLGQDLDSSGNIYTTGYFSGTIDFDPSLAIYTMASAGDEDAFVSKFDNNGNFVWAKRMGGIGSERSHGINLDATENIYTTGHFVGIVDFDPGNATYTLSSGSNTVGEAYVSKLDPIGNFMWAKKTDGSSAEDGLSVSINSLGEVYTVGYYRGLVDFDPGPGTYTLSPSGEGYIWKLDAMGNFLWAKGLDLNFYDIGKISGDVAGNIFICGLFKDTVDFDPGPGAFTVVSAGDLDIFILKLDASGNFIWVKTIGGTEREDWGKIALDSFGNVYSSGIYKAVCDFDPGPATYTYNSAGNYDCYVLKLGNNPIGNTGIQVQDNENKFEVYPNPVNDVMNIKIPANSKDFSYNINDMVGKKILSGSIKEQSAEVDLSVLSEGVYFLEIEGTGKPFKIIKQ